MDFAHLETAADIAAFAKASPDTATLSALVEYASRLETNLFHYAAAVGDRDFFGLMMAFLPVAQLTREMRRRNANGLTPLECCGSLHPAITTSVHTFFLERGIDLDGDTPASSACSPVVKLSDVVGLNAPRKKLQRIIDAGTRNPSVPLKPLLLHGPPGTGKSFLAKCLAAELGRDVVEILCQNVLSSDLGGTEARVQAHFQRAARAGKNGKKAVVVIDEFESLCPNMGADVRRGESWHSTMRQALLTIFDATVDRKSKLFGVWVVATTNFVKRVDQAARDRMTVVEVALPSMDDVKILLPALCLKHEPNLDVSAVDWDQVAAAAHEQLSVRGLHDAISIVAQASSSSSAPATTSAFESAVYERIGNVELKPLERVDRFTRVNLSLVKLLASLTPGQPNPTLATCLARCGWDFSSAPTAVYRQVLVAEGVQSLTDATLILREMNTNEVSAGSGCLRELSTARSPFDKYEVFRRCEEADGSRPLERGTMAAFVESYGAEGMQKLQWKEEESLVLFPPPAAATTVSAFLAPFVKRYVACGVFVEATEDTTLAKVIDGHLLLLKGDELDTSITGANAKRIVGFAKVSALRKINYRAFVAATPRTTVSTLSSVLYREPNAIDTLKRHEIATTRYVVCPNTASTVGATLRANEVFYAALDAVYVRQVRFIDPNQLGLRNPNGLAIHGHKLLALPTSQEQASVVWSGAMIADFAEEPSFRAAFYVYTPCEGPDQVLATGMVLLLDIENLSPPPSTERRLAILRVYPGAGQLNHDTPTHHGANRSNMGAQVHDLGYQDDRFIRGFRRGWYGDAYWRVVGDPPKHFLSGGVEGAPYKFQVTQDLDMGHTTKRAMIQLPNEGFVFCRGVGSDSVNPTMACVLFDANGVVRDKLAYRGKLGRWNDIVP